MEYFLLLLLLLLLESNDTASALAPLATIYCNNERTRHRPSYLCDACQLLSAWADGNDGFQSGWKWRCDSVAAKQC